MSNFFRVRNFERFQHYKDRNPPWIRLYGALWRDRAFFRLPDALKAHLIGMFALAARLDNRIPDDPEWLAHELCASEPIDLGALFASGFLIPEPAASAMDAGCQPSDTGSVSGSDLLCAEGENVEEIAGGATGGERGAAVGCISEPGAVEEAVSPGAVHGRRRGRQQEVKWPGGFALDEDMRQFALRLGIEPETEFEAWRDDCAAHDRRYADWRAAWRGRCRNAVRFGRRTSEKPRASPAGNAIEVALRRLREASGRERSGSET
jgi:hypothetical protein